MKIGHRLREYVLGFKRELAVYRRALEHPRTPRVAKWLLWVAVGYLVMPLDIIPDFIPVLGQLDDLIVVPALVFLALLLIPADVLVECREYVGSQRTTGKA